MIYKMNRISIVTLLILPMLMISCAANNVNMQNNVNSNRQLAHQLTVEGTRKWTQNRDLAGSIQSFELAIQADPTFIPALKFLSGTTFPLASKETDMNKRIEYIKKGKMYAERILQIDNNDLDANYLAGLFSAASNDYSDAIKYYSVVFKSNPSPNSTYIDNENKKNEVAYMLATNYGMNKDNDNALKFFKIYVDSCRLSQCNSTMLSYSNQLISLLERTTGNNNKIKLIDTNISAINNAINLKNVRISPTVATNNNENKLSAENKYLKLTVSQLQKELSEYKKKREVTYKVKMKDDIELSNLFDRQIASASLYQNLK